MTSHLKVMLSAAALAALAASPAMATSYARHHFVPADARASAASPYVTRQLVMPYVAHQLVTPYAATLQERAHEMPGPAPDFQLGGEK